MNLSFSYLKRRYLGLSIVILSIFLFPLSAVAAIARPSGMLVVDEYGSYFYTYYTPGSNYSDPRLRYAGQPEIVQYYLDRGRVAYPISNAEKLDYTYHNHGLGYPCGEVARDDEGRIAFMEPLGWPVGAQDQADPVFSYSENFAWYVPYVNWDYQGSTGSHHQDIIKQSGYHQIHAIGSLIEPSIYPFGIPNCAVVKQTGTSDYYRVFRHQTPTSVEVERKMYIPTPEVFNLWTNYNSYTYEADITALPNVGNATLPPGLVMRTISDPTVYFTDDEGNKVLIPNINIFNSLGFSPSQVLFVEQVTLNSAPTKSIY